MGVRQERLDSASIATVENPRILCACSRAYYDLSFQADIDVIRAETGKISSRVVEEHAVDARRLKEILIDQDFDIMHIAAYVDPKNGDLCFDAPISPGSDAEAGGTDRISSESFSRLVELSKASLVVLATCDSLILAAKLARVTNMLYFARLSPRSP